MLPCKPHGLAGHSEPGIMRQSMAASKLPGPAIPALHVALTLSLAGSHTDGRLFYQPPEPGQRRLPGVPLTKRIQPFASAAAFDSAMNARTWLSSTGSGTEPSASTMSWKALMSNFPPNSCSASPRRRTIANSPSL